MPQIVAIVSPPHSSLNCSRNAFNSLTIRTPNHSRLLCTMKSYSCKLVQKQQQQQQQQPSGK